MLTFTPASPTEIPKYSAQAHESLHLESTDPVTAENFNIFFKITLHPLSSSASSTFSPENHRVLFWDWHPTFGVGHLGYVDKVSFTANSIWLADLGEFAESHPEGSIVPLSVIKCFLGLYGDVAHLNGLSDCIPGLDSRVYCDSFHRFTPPLSKASVLQIQQKVAKSARRYTFHVTHEDEESGRTKFTIQREIKKNSTAPDTVPAKYGWFSSEYVAQLLQPSIGKGVKFPYRQSLKVDSDTDLPQPPVLNGAKVPIWKKLQMLEEQSKSLHDSIRKSRTLLASEKAKTNAYLKDLHYATVALKGVDRVDAARARSDTLLAELLRLRQVLSLLLDTHALVNSIDTAIAKADQIKNTLMASVNA